jgi:hypothetical protein
VTFGPRYGPQPQNNLTVKDVISSAEFAPAVMKAMQSPSIRGFMVGRSIPQRAVDTPVGANLPNAPQDKDEFFLIVNSGENVIHHMRYRASVARWEYVGGRPDYVTTLPTSPVEGDEVYYVTDASYDTVSLLRYSGTEWHQVGVPPYVTALPTPPFDGFEVFYAADASSGVIWHLRYRSGGGTHKWEYVGGPPLYAETTTNETRTSSTYGDLSGGATGPAITLPLAGDYDVEVGSRVAHGTSGGFPEQFLMSYAIGATAASDNDAYAVSQQTAATSLTYPSGSRPRRKTGLTAVALTAKYRSDNGTACAWNNRWIRATPVRVG